MIPARRLLSVATLAVFCLGSRTTSSQAKEPPRKVLPDGTWIDHRLVELPTPKVGPFVRLGNGEVLAFERNKVYSSHDEGKSWQEHAKLRDLESEGLTIDRGIVRTRKGTIILTFHQEGKSPGLPGRYWDWDEAISDAPNARLPAYVLRSLDKGRSWQKPQMLHSDWTGDNSAMIQTSTGRVVLATMKLLHNPGRHGVLTYFSDDEGATWKSSHVIDLGGVGHHGGVSEAALAELQDGRLWMLLRTNWGKFWSAFSDDGGNSWRTIHPSEIDASSAPGFLRRLKSGRLVLVWNRRFPEGKNEYPLVGGDRQWCEAPVSNHREELSMAFSDDDGKTWTEPVVIARNQEKHLSYPFVFEVKPGRLWVTTLFQGKLHVALSEADFAKP